MRFHKKVTMLIAAAVISATLFSSTALASNYTIEAKDTLYTISRMFNTNVNKLMTDNNLSSTMIYPGQVLNVPGQTYTVKHGDTMYLIAQRLNIPFNTLRKANNQWGNLIYPGQLLVLPGTPSVNTSNSTSMIIPYNNAEVNLLARLIAAEARGESYDAMVAVGGVVVNRVKSTEWPNSISAVINHVSGGYHQFTPVKNGEINKAPTDDSLKAAWAALYGKDPSNGALFFFDDSSTNQWLWSKKMTARIGAMVFVK